MRPHPARRGLELPVAVLPAAVWMARCHLLCSGLYALQLLWTGHLWMALAMIGLLAPIMFAMRRFSAPRSDAPRRLLLAADGRVHVATVGGEVLPVELAGESLWLGSAILLVLDAPGHRFRLLLGRGNLTPAALATLRRRLRGAATGPVAAAVDSGPVTAPGTSLVQSLTRAHVARIP